MEENITNKNPTKRVRTPLKEDKLPYYQTEPDSYPIVDDFYKNLDVEE